MPSCAFRERALRQGLTADPNASDPNVASVQGASPGVLVTRKGERELLPNGGESRPNLRYPGLPTTAHVIIAMWLLTRRAVIRRCTCPSADRLRRLITDPMLPA